MTFRLRPYRAEDEDAAIALVAFVAASLPFESTLPRLAWWRQRWQNELVPDAAIIVAPRAAA